jgi:hypothetical protein
VRRRCWLGTHICIQHGSHQRRNHLPEVAVGRDELARPTQPPLGLGVGARSGRRGRRVVQGVADRVFIPIAVPDGSLKFPRMPFRDSAAERGSLSRQLDDLGLTEDGVDEILVGAQPWLQDV